MIIIFIIRIYYIIKQLITGYRLPYNFYNLHLLYYNIITFMILTYKNFYEFYNIHV
jgi:hypothetical protein